MRQDVADKALKAVYEAALMPETWPDAMQMISAACNASLALGQLVGKDGYNAIASRGSEGLLRDYVDGGWHENNPRMMRGLAITQAGFRGLVTERQMFTAEERARLPFEQEFAPRYDITSEAGTVVASHAGSHFVLTVQRGLRAGSFEDDELKAMNHFVDNVAAACSFALRAKLEQAANMLDALGARGEALALLTPAGRILHFTAPFEKLLTDRLTVRNSHVHAVEAGDDVRLQELIARAADRPALASEPSNSVFLRRATGRPLVVRCLPIAGAARDFFGLARMIMTVDDLERPRSTAVHESLRDAFGLTAAEVRLAVRIGRGEMLRAAAAGEGVSFETARTRLKLIFDKTGTRRQAELAVLISRLG
ncbi:helix-turn-helix transcriptional regulator [Mesorhizobium sp. DCY119]|jgi:DNA-binding CsgD family transcriptional regulator|nr:helix-turn-helix transcriptional regulator [Mesorhizobium sp. DCY119]